MTFGFIYNYEYACKTTKLEKVEDAIQSSWFHDVLVRKDTTSYDYDAILVLAHMGHDDPLVTTILRRIRELCGKDMPVQFITGHTHRRGYTQLDEYSSSFEAGKYLDTIGLVSFPTTKRSSFHDSSPTNNVVGVSSSSSRSSQEDFTHHFINTSTSEMKQYVGVDILRTPNGSKLSNLIQETQDNLGLFEILGCSPMTYYAQHSFDKVDSLWRLYIDQVVPTQLFPFIGTTIGSDSSSSSSNHKKILIQGTPDFRYDLYAGNVSLSDIINAAPIDEPIFRIDDDIKGKYILDAFGIPNQVEVGSDLEIPSLAFVGADNILPDASYQIFSPGFITPTIQEKLAKASNKNIVPEKLDGISTGQLWKGFVRDKWSHCPPGGITTPLEMAFFKASAFILTFVFIVLFGWMFMCRPSIIPSSLSPLSSPSKRHNVVSTYDSEIEMEDFSLDEFSTTGRATPTPDKTNQSIRFRHQTDSMIV